MKFAHPVDFETFYFIELLGTVEKQGEQRFEGDAKSYLQQFVRFLLDREHPQDGILDLAQIQGTSDLSIFFSDLLERLRDFSPEDALNRKTEYARDFLDIFNELFKEKEWRESVAGLLSISGKAEEPGIDIKSFVKTENLSFFKEELPGKASEIESLFELLSSSEDVVAFKKKYEQNAELSELISTMEKVLVPDPELTSLKSFIDGFFSNRKHLAKLLEQFSTENPADFSKFCKGEVIEVVAAADDELAIMEENARKLEAKASTPGAESTEEMQLRFLLRDYIIHEIQSLSKELVQNIHSYNDFVGNSKKKETVIAVVKVFKDLGQIHKYHGIEVISDAILSSFENFFNNNLEFTPEMVQKVEDVTSEYVNYIDAVLANEEAAGMAALSAKLDALAGALEVSPETVSFSDLEQIQPVFENVNAKILAGLISDISKLEEGQQIGLTNFEKNKDHLLFWYEYLKLENAADVLKSVHNFISKPNLVHNIREKKAEILAIYNQLAQKLFATTSEYWEELVHALIIEDADSVSLADAWSAYQEVAHKYLKVLQSNVSEMDAWNALNKATLYGLLNEFNQSTTLADRPHIAKLGIHLHESLDKFDEVPDAKVETLKELLTVYFTDIKLTVNRLPEESDSGDIVQKFEDSLNKALAQPEEELAEIKPEEVVETKPESREAYIDQELTDIFQAEAEKYLDQITEALDQFENDIHNTEILEKIGNLTHTLKGSAQMLDQSHIAEIASPFEDFVDRIVADELNIDITFIQLYRDAVDTLRDRLDEPDLEAQSLIDKLDLYINANKSLPTDQVPEEIQEETAAQELLEQIAEEETPETVPEQLAVEVTDAGIPMLRLSERDPELIDIFKNEALNNLQILENDFTLIEKFTYDKKTLHSIDQASHEVRAAAKMLGFTEIGDLMDRMENLVERTSKMDTEPWSGLVPVFRKVIQVVRELAENLEVPKQLYDDALNSMIEIEEQLLTQASAPAATPEVQGRPVAAEIKEKTLKPSAQVFEAFIHEARDFLEDINFILLKLEKNPENEELSHHLLRNLHTLKGSAAMVYVEPVENLAHVSEDILEKFQEKGDCPSQESIDLMFEVVDEIEFVVDGYGSGMEGKTKNYEAVLEKLKKFFEETFETEIPAPAEDVEIGEALEPETDYLQVTDKLDVEVDPSKRTFVRLHVDQMDDLLNQAAEMVINHTQFKTQLDKFKNYLPRMDSEGKNLQNILWYLDTIISEEKRISESVKPMLRENPSIEEAQRNQVDNIQRVIHNLEVYHNSLTQTVQSVKELSKHFDEQVHKILRLSTHIHEDIMEARLVQIELLFQRFNRPLRDIARQAEKKIRVFMEGETTELDRVLIEELYEPLLHILRNAVDHGIEIPAERKNAGKSEEGLIQISAKQERNFVTIEVRDDGAGINYGKVKNRAVELGLIATEKADKISDDELTEFLLHPGFSTATETTKLSGRGVGLDVVHNQIQKIKGDLRIYSRPGEGTRFTIRVPISLTVTQAMLVDVAAHVYAIPLTQVEETINVTIKDLELQNGIYYMQHRGAKLPVLYMANLLQIRGGKKRPVSPVGEYPAIIVQDDGVKAALLLDKIVQREEILIKSLGPNLQRVRYIAGGSVLADGKVVLVLDVPQVIKEAGRIKESDAALNPDDFATVDGNIPVSDTFSEKNKREKKVIEGRQAKILVVDDSVSIRKFLAGLLTQKGFAIEMAKNGYHALEKLADQDFDLVITDLEMPQLSGYELIEQIRTESRWDDLPIIVLTGRASKHIQQLTMNLGADEFIIKPFKENDLLSRLSQFIKMKI